MTSGKPEKDGGKVNGKTCGTHPGISCSEAHVDDSMKIASLTERVKELEAWKTGKRGIEDFYILRQKLWDAKDKIAALTRQLEILSGSKTGVPCQGGFHYCRCGVTVNVGYLQKRIAELETELTAEQILRVNKYANAERLIEWMDDPNRKSANTSFTEGPERQIAYRFERLQDNNKFLAAELSKPKDNAPF